MAELFGSEFAIVAAGLAGLAITLMAILHDLGTPQPRVLAVPAVVGAGADMGGWLDLRP